MIDVGSDVIASVSFEQKLEQEGPEHGTGVNHIVAVEQIELFGATVKCHHVDQPGKYVSVWLRYKHQLRYKVHEELVKPLTQP